MPTDYNLACGPSCALCSSGNAFERGTCGTNGICSTDCITRCAGNCVSTLTNADHCGACNVACTSGQRCSKGECRTLCVGGPGLKQLLPTVPLPTGAAFSVVDLTGDGVADVLSFEGSAVRIRVGQTGALAGTFGAVSPLVTLSFTPTGFVTGDLTQDGRPEIVAWSSGSSTLAVLRNSGTGSFTLYTFVPSTSAFGVTTNITSATIGEFNGAAPADVVVGLSTASSTQSAALFVGVTGTGNPLSTAGIGAGLGISNVAQVRAANLNGDAISDLVVAASISGIYVYPGRAMEMGMGPFSVPQAVSAQLPSGETFPTAPFAFEVADVTGDGVSDVVTAVLSGSGFGARVYPLTATPSLGASTLLPLSGLVRTIALADVDGDNRRDVVMQGGVVAIARSLVGSTFTAPVVLPVTTGTALSSLAAIDLTGDSSPELLFPSGTALAVLVNDGDGAYPAVMGASVGSAGRIIAGDFNGDGVTDVVASPTAFSGPANAHLVLGGSTLTVGPSLVVRSEVMAVGQLNSDALHDVVSIGQLGDAGVDAGLSIDVRLGSSAAPLSVVAVQLVPSGTPRFLAVSDLEGDGDTDVVAVTSTGVEWFPQGAAMSFGARRVIATGTSWTSLAIADVNNDGRVDLLLAQAGSSSGVVQPWLNQGSGFVAGAFVSASGVSGFTVLTDDFNNDGRFDFLLGENVVRGSGQASFSFSGAVTSSGRLRQALGDLDNDGPSELLAVSGGSDLLVARGDFASANGFLSTVLLGAGLPLVDVAIGKVDADAYRDVVMLVGAAGNRQVVALPAVCR